MYSNIEGNLLSATVCHSHVSGMCTGITYNFHSNESHKATVLNLLPRYSFQSHEMKLSHMAL